MRALAAGGGASVQHALAGVQVEQVGRALRAKVLHRNLTRVESRQSLARERPVEQQRLAAAWPRVDALLGELAVIGRYGGAPPIHAQARGRMIVPPLEPARPCRGIRSLHELDPPCGMLMPGDRVALEPRQDRA